jgi:hypothetical protein
MICWYIKSIKLYNAQVQYLWVSPHSWNPCQNLAPLPLDDEVSSRQLFFPLGSCALYVDTPITTDPIQYIWCQNPQSLRWCLPKQPPIKIQYGQQVSVHQQCRLNLGILDVSSRRRITSKKQETRGSRYGDRKKYFDGMNIFVVFWL